MRNIKMIIQYDGGRYKGWQKQNIKGTSVSTIQDKIEKVLEKRTGIIGKIKMSEKSS